MSEQIIHSLPAPLTEALQHSEKTHDYIVQCLDKQNGRMSFQEYMQHALYAPGLGYYAAGAHKLGAAGDFVTAPELSSVFSRCIARAIKPVLAELETAQLPAVVYEFGAGRGRMAADIIRELFDLDVNLAHYYIVEVSPDLIARQREYLQTQLPEFINNVSWLSELPEAMQGVVVGNEVLDAMPVCLFRKTNGKVVELGVAEQNDSKPGSLTLVNMPDSNSRLAQRVADIETALSVDFVEGYTSEVNFLAEDWLSEIATRLQRGAILLIDYGYPRHEYYHAQRHQGTLMCHYQHHSHIDPFVYPGIQDITAHIDFTAMASTALDKGLRLDGYTTQANFLLENQLEEILQSQSDEDPQKMLILSREVQKLIMPHEMGELFKVIGFSKNCDISLPAFEFRDLREHL